MYFLRESGLGLSNQKPKRGGSRKSIAVTYRWALDVENDCEFFKAPTQFGRCRTSEAQNESWERKMSNREPGQCR